MSASDELPKNLREWAAAGSTRSTWYAEGLMQSAATEIEHLLTENEALKRASNIELAKRLERAEATLLLAKAWAVCPITRNESAFRDALEAFSG